MRSSGRPTIWNTLMPESGSGNQMKDMEIKDAEELVGKDTYTPSTQQSRQSTKVTAMCSSSFWYAQNVTMRMRLLFNRCKCTRRNMEDICSMLRMSMGMLHFAETIRRKANSIRSLIRRLVELSGASVREMDKFACACVAPVIALALALANALQSVCCQ